MLDDDKARRNIVAFSSAILLGAWLELPVHSIVQRLLGSETAAFVEPARVWIAALCVMLYLMHRFWFGKDGTDAKERMSALFYARRPRNVRRIIAAAFSKYNKSGFDDAIFQYGQQRSLRGAIEASFARGKTKVGDVEVQYDRIAIDPEAGGPALQTTTAPLTGQVPARMSGDQPGMSVRLSPYFSISGRRLLLSDAHSAASIALWSETTADLVLPLVLWASAVYIAVIRVWDSFYIQVT